MKLETFSQTAATSEDKTAYYYIYTIIRVFEIGLDLLEIPF